MLGFLAVGVNGGLRHAEDDAVRVGTYLSRSALAPPSCGGAVLVGRRATRREVVRHLRLAAAAGVRRFLFYFSGHGSASDIALLDGSFTYRELRMELARLGADNTLVVLDACRAGGILRDVLGGLGESKVASVDYLAAMARAVPGTRVLASSAWDEDSHESDGVGGHFTSTLLHVLETAPSDLSVGSTQFVSDRAAMGLTRRIMARTWGTGQLPVVHGLLGDFPLARGQDVAVVGQVEVTAIVPYATWAALATLWCGGRRLVPSRVRLRVVGASGRVLAESVPVDVQPTENDQRWRVWLEAHAASTGYGSNLELLRDLALPALWVVDVEDSHADVIARRRVWVPPVRLLRAA